MSFKKYKDSSLLLKTNKDGFKDFFIIVEQ